MMKHFLLLIAPVLTAITAAAFEPAIGSVTTTTSDLHELSLQVVRKLNKAADWASAPADVITDFFEESGFVADPLVSDVPSMAPSDIPSLIPSDVPSDMPSDMPSMIPSDLPSLSPVSWEDKEAPPPVSGEDARLESDGSSNKSIISDDNSNLVLPLTIGLGACFVALLTAFVVFRLRRRSLARDVDAEVQMDDMNDDFLEEGVSPRAPSPVAASNQFDSQFSEDDNGEANSHASLSQKSSHGDVSRTNLSKESSHGMSSYQMSDVGDLDSKLSGSLLGYPQLSNTVTL